MIIVGLLLLGLCFGSFVNALVWRLHKQSQTKNKTSRPPKPNHSSLTTNHYSILHGRSMCPHCKHQLTSKDLIPIVSWLSLGGKCRYCQKPISWQYPAVELITAALFIASYLFWPTPATSAILITPHFPHFQGQALEIVGFGVWLAAVVGLVALVVYDLRWMLLPNKIVFPLAWLGGASVVVSVVDEHSLQPIVNGLLGSLVGGGLFYLLFQVSKGRWIGGGDVKLGFVLGLLLGSPQQALLMIFLASLLGSLVVLPLLALKKVTPKTRIPFGPFLVTATFITQLWGAQIADWYLAHLVVR